MQNPEPWPGKAWCVPPAVLHARPRLSASSAVSSVPAISGSQLILVLVRAHVP